MNSTPPAVRFGNVSLGRGVRLHYAESGPAGGEAVLFLHGYTDSWYSFSPVLPRLPASLHAFAPDQRGHGDSERPAAGYSLGDFAADAVRFLDAVGVGRATVVGHSMGSFIAQKLALDYPHRVERLVLVGSSDNPKSEAVLGMWEQVQALIDPVPPEFVRAFQASTAYAALPGPFLDRVVAESSKLPARLWREVLAGLLAGDCRSELHRVRCPTLILWGDRETTFLQAEQQRLLAAIPGAELRVYGQTGHALHWEQPGRFAQDLRAFLRARPAGAAGC